jgi:hypothetical protein
VRGREGFYDSEFRGARTKGRPAAGWRRGRSRRRAAAATDRPGRNARAERYNNTRSAAAAAGESMCLRHTDRSREPITHLNSRQPTRRHCHSRRLRARVKRDRNPPPGCTYSVRECACFAYTADVVSALVQLSY